MSEVQKIRVFLSRYENFFLDLKKLIYDKTVLEAKINKEHNCLQINITKLYFIGRTDLCWKFSIMHIDGSDILQQKLDF